MLVQCTDMSRNASCITHHCSPDPSSMSMHVDLVDHSSAGAVIAVRCATPRLPDAACHHPFNMSNLKHDTTVLLHAICFNKCCSVACLL